MTVGKHGAWRKPASWACVIPWAYQLMEGTGLGAYHLPRVGTSIAVFFLHSLCISCKALPLTLSPSLWQSPKQSLSEDVRLPRIQPELKHHFLDCIFLRNTSLPGLHHFLESSISRGPWDQQLLCLILSLSPVGSLEVTLLTFSCD